MGVEQLFQEVLAGRSICYTASAFLVLALALVIVYLVCALLNPTFKGSALSVFSSYETSKDEEAAANTRFWEFTKLWMIRAIFPLVLVGVCLSAVSKLFPTSEDMKVIGAYRAVKEFGDSAAFNAALSSLLDSWAVKEILVDRHEEQQETEPGSRALPEEGSEAGKEVE